MNVLKYCMRPSYYFKHPIKFFKETWSNLVAAYMRVTKGYSYGDTWNLDNWLENVLPPMLRHLADNGCAYPAFKNEEVDFSTPEKWHDWLHSIADVIESTQEKNWAGQNEYQEDFEHLLSHPNLTCTCEYSEEDKKFLRKLFWDREVELEQQRRKLREETLITLIKYIDFIWD